MTATKLLYAEVAADYVARWKRGYMCVHTFFNRSLAFPLWEKDSFPIFPLGEFKCLLVKWRGLEEAEEGCLGWECVCICVRMVRLGHQDFLVEIIRCLGTKKS